MENNAFNTDEFTTPQGTWETPKTESKKFDAAEFIRDYKNQAQTAAATGNWRVMEAFRALTVKLLRQLLDMAKQAVEFAISKFLVELCAMVIAGISAALMKKHGRPVDISTPHVFYNNGGAPAGGQQNSSQPQQSLWGQGSPFDSGWSSSRGAGAW